MSFEGYYQFLCERGHLIQRDVYEHEPESCPHCQSKIAFSNLVDETNCQSDGLIEFEVEVPANISHCEHCGLDKTIEPIRYKIPSKNQNAI
jgi:hypothetical protein